MRMDEPEERMRHNPCWDIAPAHPPPCASALYHALFKGS